MIEKLKSNIHDVRERITNAAKKSGRPADDICLVAVTKYVDAETTAMVVQAGCTNVGESRPQVLFEKFDALGGTPVHWHMIGHLQRNKAARTVKCSHLIHSVDSLRLLTAISHAATAIEKVQAVLLEINVSAESAKHGFTAAELPTALDHARDLPGAEVQGLMCMAGLSGTADVARREFASLRTLRDAYQDMCGGNIRLDDLSMGMSGDFETAIEEGATIVRIGSILFDGVVA